MMMKILPKPGFTLLEILIATAAFMIVMVIAVSIFSLTVSNSSATEQLRLTTQAARYAFESMSREARLAKGLVYVDGEDPHMVIPPFQVIDGQTEEDKVIQLYQVKNNPDELSPLGETLYSVTRRLYYRDPAGGLRIDVQTGDASATDKTAQELYNLVRGAGISWTVVSSDSILPAGFIANQLKVVRSLAYPTAASSLTTLSAQAYIQLDMTVENQAYNSSRDNNKQIRITLRTMIVPRSFANPYEVVQGGVQPPVQE